MPVEESVEVGVRSGARLQSGVEVGVRIGARLELGAEKRVQRRAVGARSAASLPCRAELRVFGESRREVTSQRQNGPR